MKKLTTSILISSLALLTACGGGGGGGFTGTSTLPEIVSPASSDGASITPMSYSVSTETEATQLIENNLDSDYYTSNGVSVVSTSGVSVMALGGGACSNKNDCNKRAFQRLKNNFINKNYSDLASLNLNELREALLLVGAPLPNGCRRNQKDCSSVAGILVGINEKVFNSLKEKAKKLYDNYGSGSVTLENATLNFSSDESDNAYVKFTLDDKNNVDAMILDTNTGSEIDLVKLNRNSDDKFEGTFKIYQYGIIIGVDCDKGACSPAAGHDIVYESFEKITDINVIKEKLLAELQKEYESGALEGLHGGTNNGSWQEGDIEKLVDSAQKMINDLTIEDFNRTDMDNMTEEHAYSNIETSTLLTKYNSYAKDMDLAYSDFGEIKLNVTESHSSREEGNSENIETSFVFAGGYEAKKIDPSLIAEEMNFAGKAKGSVIYSEEDNHIDSNNVLTKTLDLDGDLALNFKDGQETLNAKFNNWYDVTVTNNFSDPSKRDIAFSNGNKIEDADFKFRGQDLYHVNDMQGDQQVLADGDEHVVVGADSTGVTGDSFGTVRIGYYGDAGQPSEATGYVAYLESLPFKSGEEESYDRIKMLDMEMAFGAKKQ